MKRELVQNTYRKEDIILDGNRFLLGNGHLGYRGTLEEYGKEELVSLLIAGVYDQYQDQWRENLSLPNPFFFRAYHEGKEVSVLTQEPSSHQTRLDIAKALYHRESQFDELSLSSTRFVSHDDDALLGERIEIIANRAGNFTFRYGLNCDIYEIHGPHFAAMDCQSLGDQVQFHGVTNEGKSMYLLAQYRGFEGKFDPESGLFEASVSLQEGQKVVLDVLCRVDEEVPALLPKKDLDSLCQASIHAYEKKLEACKVEIEGDEDLDFEIAYSLYHLLILGDEKRIRSIAARGVSGQTYKGAIFWDTEIFLLPFFVLANPTIARNLLLYRIRTLQGALSKAKSLGFDGAYYAWESQDTGLEACRSDNVTDPVTGETVPTYFGTKQIHISADVVYAIDRYIKATGDDSILDEGADEVIFECGKFFLSYSSLDEQGVRHLNDVIGPDEYHERVDDEAFTLHMAERVMRAVEKYVCPNCLNEEEGKLYDLMVNAKWAEPRMKNGVIEEFKGYFDLEDVDVETLRKRLVHAQDYWGGKNGVATKTQVIKQADVVALLALCPEDYDEETKRANYDYYFRRTEHGSSLSASMHCLLGVHLGREEEAYRFLRSSSGIDIRGAEKLFAGGVYIGGTHPAANAGAYLGLVFGYLGAELSQGELTLDPRLPQGVHKVTFRYQREKKIYEAIVYGDGHYEIKEAKQ